MRPRSPAWASGSLASGAGTRRRDERHRSRAGPSRMLRDVQTLTIALAQIAPRLGSLDINLATHHALLEDARAKGAGLVVFPELGLTGYQPQDLASECEMRRDDP